MSIVDNTSTLGDVRADGLSEVDCDLRGQSSLECEASDWITHQCQRNHVNSHFKHTSLPGFRSLKARGNLTRVPGSYSWAKKLLLSWFTSMRHLSLFTASSVVKKGYTRYKGVFVGICLILWGEVVSIIVPVCP